MLSCFPVYKLYISPSFPTVLQADIQRGLKFYTVFLFNHSQPLVSKGCRCCEFKRRYPRHSRSLGIYYVSVLPEVVLVAVVCRKLNSSLSVAPFSYICLVGWQQLAGIFPRLCKNIISKCFAFSGEGKSGGGGLRHVTPPHGTFLHRGSLKR